MFGKIENPKNEHLRDLNWRECATFAPLLVLAFWMGLYPAPFIARLQTSVNRFVARVKPDYREQNPVAVAKPAPVPTPAVPAVVAVEPVAINQTAPPSGGQR